MTVKHAVIKEVGQDARIARAFLVAWFTVPRSRSRCPSKLMSLSLQAEAAVPSAIMLALSEIMLALLPIMLALFGIMLALLFKVQ